MESEKKSITQIMEKEACVEGADNEGAEEDEGDRELQESIMAIRSLVKANKKLFGG